MKLGRNDTIDWNPDQYALITQVYIQNDCHSREGGNPWFRLHKILDPRLREDDILLVLFNGAG